jgi:hypothetical protein
VPPTVPRGLSFWRADRPEPCSNEERREDQRDMLIPLSRAPARGVAALSVALVLVAFCCTQSDGSLRIVEAIPGHGT